MQSAHPVSSTIQFTTSFNAEPTRAFSASGTKKRNIEAIVGPVVAVVVIIFAALLALLWWRRRRQVTLEKDETVIPFPRNDRPEPWYKGMEANPIPPTRIVYTAAVGSKRPPPPLHPCAIDTVAHTESRASVDPSASILPPTFTQSTSSSVPSPPQTLDVNQIIELIAQRIDPATRGSVVDELAPPRYPS
ncbi:hypothetical protein PHLCEN_2v2779 [Hermanssonia centrifuga]|uniref:Uncharacterized protein n=1 Tax=Hermanssonia centrifuga TaxID=98765 RepID=A0A2R6RHZ7_9APHY|nr:hypothetical protein PHLCEN_2v2779 [Hermanssonia centrifuga]